MDMQHSKKSQQDVVSSRGRSALTFGIVIFGKNEAVTLGPLIDEVAQKVDRRDIFVVDGHSTDDTVAVVGQRNVRFLLDNGKGKGAAIRFAIREIDRDLLVFMDSDGSHKPDEILSLLKPFDSDPDVAMVVGSRFQGGSEEFSRSLTEISRRIGNLLSTFIINVRWRVRLTETQNGFRAVRRSAVLGLGLIEDSFAIEQELTMKCLKKGMKVVEVPSFELQRTHGRSHVVPYEMLPKYISCFFRNVFS